MKIKQIWHHNFALFLKLEHDEILQETLFTTRVTREKYTNFAPLQNKESSVLTFMDQFFSAENGEKRKILSKQFLSKKINSESQ